MAQLVFDPVRQPRLQALVNGAPVTGAISGNVTLTAHLSSARWSVEAAFTPDQTAAWWSSQTAMTVEIKAQLSPAEGWTSLVVGDVDDLDVDLETTVVSMSGRDLSARLLDTKSSEAYPNQSSSEIVQMLAAKHGLQADVTATSGAVGQFYQLEHARTTHDAFSKFSNEWELLVYLAQHEDYDLSVDGNTLRFHPKSSSTDTVDISYDASVTPPVSVVSNLRLKRSMTLAKDVKVVVRSWDSKKATAHEVTATRSKSGSKASSDIQTYTFIKPNVSPEAAQQFANAKLSELSRHEKTMSFDCPGELTMTTRQMISLTGTGTAFDQNYYVDSIERSISLDGGFHQSVSAKNHDPNSEVTES